MAWDVVALIWFGWKANSTSWMLTSAAAGEADVLAGDVMTAGGVVVEEDEPPDEHAAANSSAVQLRTSDRLIMATA
jgi:hypothetical protein